MPRAVMGVEEVFALEAAVYAVYGRKRQPYVRGHQPGEGERNKVSGSVETAWRSGMEASAKGMEERRCQVSSAHTALGFQSGCH